MNEDLSQNNNEFKIFGITIEKLSIIYGLFLIFWGIMISFLSNSNSLTSYIPSILGIPVFIFGYLSTKFNSKKKLFMHLVVFFGLIIFIGGLDFIRSIIIGNFFANYWADMSKLMMLLTGFFFIYQCVRSFIHARKNRDANI
mgnify:CR=1 FL=1|tara:strand:+ start:74 stop:499 length:426 start_codon:yes stop_codon:yes gene_type:complete